MTLTTLVIGEIGAGKSSLINLLADRTAAGVSADAVPCTKRFQPHEIVLDSTKVRIYDTVGFNNAEKHSADPRLPFESSCELMQSLTERVDLLILCTKAKRFTHHTHRIYRLFYEVFFDKTVPIVLVVTHREAEVSMDGWWVRNLGEIQKSGLELAGHACITTVQEFGEGGDVGRYGQSARAVKELLLKTVISGGGVHARVPTFSLQDRLFNAKDIVSSWSLPSDDARAIEHQIRRLVLRMKNVVVFGETGVGKSSIVNLIAGAVLADVSDGARGCTMEWKDYHVTLNQADYRMFDTVGLNGAEVRGDDYLTTLVKAYELIDTLAHAGGVDLLLFCIRLGRITKATQSNYKLYHDFLCDKKVPMVIVITHAEDCDDVDGWWKKNKQDFEKYGIGCSNHIFVTASTRQVNADRRLESRNSLLDCIEHHTACPSVGLFILNTDNWFVMFLKKIGELVIGKQYHRKKVIADLLIKSLGFSKERALFLIEKIGFLR